MKIQALRSEELLAKQLEAPPRTPLLFVESAALGRRRSPDRVLPQLAAETNRMKIDSEVVAGPPLTTVAVERG